MRLLISTSKFKRAFRKFVKRNANLQQRIEDTLEQMEVDVFAANLVKLIAVIQLPPKIDN